MATDFFVSALFIPILGIILALVIFRIFAKKICMNKTIFGLKWGAILSGTLGALVGLYVFAAATSYFEAIDRVAEFESLREQGAASLAWGWSIYLFILFAPFLLIGIALLFYPMFAVLSQLRLVSALGVLLVVLIIVVATAGFTYASPGNNWCETNLFLCVQRSAMGTLAFAIPVAIGFVIGARLPIFFSKKRVD